MSTHSSGKQIAKNSLFLYIRMGITMLVGLYTSRVVLQVLGVEDYGVYNMVGGIVGMLAFLNSAMSSVTSRFLTFELGRGDKKRMNDTFKASFEQMYAYTNQPNTGIRHAMMDSTGSYSPGSEEALYFLVTCSAFVNYLHTKTSIKENNG